jgi:asparagine synthase (glutamine-hydrolysing)
VSYLPEYDGRGLFRGDAIGHPANFHDALWDEYWATAARFPNAIDQVMYVDAKTSFVDARIQLQDKMSMAVGLEVREPLIDHKLVEFAGTIPAGLKIPGFV